MEPWIQTWMGYKFDLINPTPMDIHILDIAVPLSKLCRYNGHCVEFHHYSVAEHCCHISDNCSDKNKLWGLMHDAAEAYIGDIPAPVKDLAPDIKEAEQRIIDAIVIRFDMNAFVMPFEVHGLDVQICIDEKAQVMLATEHKWKELPDMPPLGVDIQFWGPEKAFNEFMIRFEELKIANNRD